MSNFEKFVFPTKGVGKGKLREAVLVRSSRRDTFSPRIGLLENPDRVIYRLEGTGAYLHGYGNPYRRLREYGRFNYAKDE